MALDPSNSSNLEQLALKGLLVTSAVSRTVSELWRFIGQKSPFGHSPVSFNVLARGDPLRMLMNLISPNTRYIVLLASEDSIILWSFVLTQYRRVTDRQTDIQKCYSKYRALHSGLCIYMSLVTLRLCSDHKRTLGTSAVA